VGVVFAGCLGLVWVLWRCETIHRLSRQSRVLCLGFGGGVLALVSSFFKVIFSAFTGPRNVLSYTLAQLCWDVPPVVSLPIPQGSFTTPSAQSRRFPQDLTCCFLLFPVVSCRCLRTWMGKLGLVTWVSKVSRTESNMFWPSLW